MLRYSIEQDSREANDELIDTSDVTQEIHDIVGYPCMLSCILIN